VRGTRGPWFLLNASPDLRQQLAGLPTGRSSAIRETPIGGVVLTDAEIDHASGLLLLRESSAPLRVWSTEAVHGALSEGFPVLRMLERYCGVEWMPIEPGQACALEGSSLEIEAFETGGDPPLYMGTVSGGPGSIGLTVRDRDNEASIAYAPALAALDQRMAERLERSHCVFVDGTFWSGDELVRLGVADRDGAAMGHLPLAGPDGSLGRLSALQARTILIHLNNTNPILIEGSPERLQVEASGIEVAYDGMEIAV
jgi:pyrroloquinoline quinone biosynthesis protein B